MDVWSKIRVLIWLMIFSLWGVMVYQFLEEEESEAPSYVGNPYRGRAAAPPPTEPARVLPQPTPPEPAPPEPEPPVAPPAEGDRIMISPEAPPAAGAIAGSPKLDFMKPLPPKLPRAPRPTPRPTRPRQEGKLTTPDPPVPPGFVKTQTRHFNVYAEGDAASQDFLDLVESLHGNLMLDLAAFSPWARDEKVSIFLFKSQDTYREVTGRPAWSGGASSVPKRKVYVYESDELTGILAHELCHIYFDGFFIGGRANPLWLSEGMATLVQIERGLAAPNWLRENLDILKGEGGFTLSDLMRVTSTGGAEDEKVRLWYTQAYSIVRFLIRYQYKSSFYGFSRFLRDGKSPSEALYRAYGAPFTSIRALEHAWRYDITTNALTQLSQQAP